jgi:hypothetical protein
MDFSDGLSIGRIEFVNNAGAITCWGWRLQRQPKGVIRLTSDNPAYDLFSVSLQDEGTDFVIVGRVVWVGRKLGV